MTFTATFTIDLRPAAERTDASPDAPEFCFEKHWSGAVEGTSRGTMLTGGDPATGDAGYVALETFEGRIGDREGRLTFLQLGEMTGGEPSLHYVIAPGSGTGDLEGAAGSLTVGEIDDAGVHQVTVELR